MPFSTLHVRDCQSWIWRLPPADPERWLAAIVALHHVFDGSFTGKTWLCRRPSAKSPTFAPIALAQLASGAVSLDACRALVHAAGAGGQCTLGRGEHLIACGSVAAGAAMVERWQLRSAFVIETAANTGVATLAYVRQRDAIADPGLAEILEPALRAISALALHQTGDVGDTADLVEAIRSALPLQSITRTAVEPAPDLFIRRFSALAAQTPDRPAIVAVDARISYSELARATDSIAHRWRRFALSAGDRLLVVAPRGPALVATMLASFKAGLAVCLIDPRQPDAYVAACQRIVRPALVVNLTGRDLGLPDVPVVTCVDFDVDAQAPQICTDCFGADDCAIVTLTSGTTREPKAVAGRYGSLTRFFDGMNDRYGPLADAAFGMCSSIGHDPLQRDILTPLYLGGCIVIPDERDLSEPRRLPNWLATQEIDVVCLNAALVPWLGASVTLPHLRLLLCVGGALTRAQALTLRAAVPQARIVSLYGATETQRAVGFYELPRDPAALARLPEVVPLGRGMPGVDLIVRDCSRDGLTVPFQIGEIALRSRHLALGYLADAELTARRFRCDLVFASDDVPAYLTGDLGYVSPSYGVIFAGRIDDQHKISGYRVELAAIDDMCRQHPDVGNAATLVVQTDGLPTLATCVVPAQAGASLDGLRGWLAQRLPHYLVPHRICVMDDLPLTLNRKVDARALAARVQTAALPDDTSGPIDAFVRRHTGLADPPHDVPLADLGIDSLRFVALIDRLRGEKGAGAAALHNGMSVRELGAALSDRALPDRACVATACAARPRRATPVHTSPRDLLGPVLDITETAIRFARGTFDHCCSNSYLGLSGRPEIRARITQFFEGGYAHGTHGSAELNGFTAWHEQLATAIRTIYGRESAVLYGSGYLANVSAIPALIEGNAQLFVDESCHQSLVDGCRLSGAPICVYRHNDADSLEQLLASAPRSACGARAIVTEGLFSIEGDLLDLPAFHALARRYECLLIVDEACSLGQAGADGCGVESHYAMPGAIDVITGTLAKTLGSTGGYVACSADCASRLRFQRGASFSSSLTAMNAFIALQGVQLLRDEGRVLKARLDRNIVLWRDGLASLGFDTGRSGGAVVPIVCADADAVAVLFRRALDLGVYALPVSAPWSSRMNVLRTSVTAAHAPDRLREIIARFAADMVSA